ncbi:MAG: hypothetical protein MUC92_13570 [Fimbriimonadaceae bacterium]|nr:hypothetical protein [Fimbriimonadaceae bacterium]
MSGILLLAPVLLATQSTAIPANDPVPPAQIVQAFPEASLTFSFPAVLAPRRDPLAEIKQDLTVDSDRLDDLLWQGESNGLTLNFSYVLHRAPLKETSMGYLEDIKNKLHQMPGQAYSDLEISEVRILGRKAARLTFNRPTTNSRGAFHTLIEGNRRWSFDFFWPSSREVTQRGMDQALATIRVMQDEAVLRLTPYRQTSPKNGLSVALPFSPGWRDLPNLTDPPTTNRGYFGTVLPSKISFHSWSHRFGGTLVSDHSLLVRQKTEQMRREADRNTFQGNSASTTLSGAQGLVFRGTYLVSRVKWWFEHYYLNRAQDTWLIEIAVSESGGGQNRLRQIVTSLKIDPPEPVKSE